MSRGDLAFAVRRDTQGGIKATERGIRGWEKGENAPSGLTVAVLAKILGTSIEFFYTSGADEDDEEVVLPSADEFLRALRPLFVPGQRAAA